MTWSVCAFHGLLGVGCPGCGLLRSIFFLLKGDVAGSIAWHPMGIPVVLWLVHFGWWRSFALSPLGRQLVSHAVLFGFFVPWFFRVMASVSEAIS